MIIGNFTYTKATDSYDGEIHTLTLRRDKVAFRPAGGKTDKAPNYRVVIESETGTIELGAAWYRVSESGRDYLSVSLDDPALDHPLNLALMPSDKDNSAILVWSRQVKRDAQAA